VSLKSIFSIFSFPLFPYTTSQDFIIFSWVSKVLSTSVLWTFIAKSKPRSSFWDSTQFLGRHSCRISRVEGILRLRLSLIHTPLNKLRNLYINKDSPDFPRNSQANAVITYYSRFEFELWCAWLLYAASCSVKYVVHYHNTCTDDTHFSDWIFKITRNTVVAGRDAKSITYFY
jgi:hypothetical protein